MTLRYTAPDEQPSRKDRAAVKQKHDRLNNFDSAAYLGLQPETLAQWRYLRKFQEELPYFKIGRKVFYSLSDLEAFVNARKIGGPISEDE